MVKTFIVKNDYRNVMGNVLKAIALKESDLEKLSTAKNMEEPSIEIPENEGEVVIPEAPGTLSFDTVLPEETNTFENPALKEESGEVVNNDFVVPTMEESNNVEIEEQTSEIPENQIINSVLSDANNNKEPKIEKNGDIDRLIEAITLNTITVNKLISILGADNLAYKTAIENTMKSSKGM